MSGGSIQPPVPMTKELKLLLDRENRYIKRLREVQMQYYRNEKLTVGAGEVEHLRNELESIYDILNEYDKEYVSLRRSRPISLKEIRAKLGSIDRNATLIEYFVVQEELFIFVVNQRSLYVHNVKVTRDKLMQCIENYQKEVVQYTDLGYIGNFSLQELSRYLLEPVSEHISNASLIYFVPHDMLHYIPIHAVSLNGEHIIKYHPIAYIMSASLLQYYLKDRKGLSHLDNSASFGVALRDEEKIFADESEMISHLLGGQHFANATKQTVLSNWSEKDILHFSCHGYFNNIDRLSSGIMFRGNVYRADGGYAYDVLTAREIFNVKEKISADLLTLSACQTGLSDREPGDDLVGLTRSLLYTGAASIIVSLWSVYAGSTMDLMKEFYTRLKDRKDKASALQQAMIKIMANPEYAHPYFWAPFILIGDWK
jgi:CHAT domain-containing protein